MDQSSVSPATAALNDAIKAAGSQNALAVALKVTPQAVNEWLKKGRVPAGRARDVEAVTGVSRHRLRSDIFGDPDAGPPS